MGLHVRHEAMVVVGLTGGFGTGKSTVAKMLSRRGAIVLDADAITHELMHPDRPAWREIRRVFGPAMCDEDRAINRRRLAERVFRDPSARRRLEAILHPRVLRRLKQDVKRLRRAGRVRVVVLDVPLLIETGLHRDVDLVVVVTASPAVQRRRLAAKGFANDAIARRIRAQGKPAAKVALADFVIDNTDGLERTRRQVSTLWSQRLAVKPNQRRD